MQNKRLMAGAGLPALGRGALIAGIAVLVVACGLQKGPQADGSGHRHSERAVACTRRDLKMRLDARAATVAAGTAYIPLDLTNISGKACRLAGFLIVAAADHRRGPRIGAAATRARADRAARLTLRARHTAHAWILLAKVRGLPVDVCWPVRAAGLRVRLPGHHRTTFLRHRLTTCSTRIRGADILSVEPFNAGRARRGAAQ
jgi:hypothetical protein